MMTIIMLMISTTNYMLGRINCPSAFLKTQNCQSEARTNSKFSKIKRVIYPKNCSNQPSDYWLITLNQQTVFIETSIL